MPWYILLALFALGAYLVFSNIEKLQELKSRTNNTGIKIGCVIDMERIQIQRLEWIATAGVILMAIGSWPVLKFLLLLIVP